MPGTILQDVALRGIVVSECLDHACPAWQRRKLTPAYGYGTSNNNGNVRSQTISFAAIGGAPAFTEAQTYPSYDALNRPVTAQTALWTETNCWGWGPDWYGRVVPRRRERVDLPQPAASLGVSIADTALSTPSG